MNYPVRSVVFSPNKIQVVCSSTEVIENWEAKSNEDFMSYEIAVEVTNLHIKSICLCN